MNMSTHQLIQIQPYPNISDYFYDSFNIIELNLIKPAII